MRPNLGRLSDDFIFLQQKSYGQNDSTDRIDSQITNSMQGFYNTA